MILEENVIPSRHLSESLRNLKGKHNLVLEKKFEIVETIVSMSYSKAIHF